MYTPKFKEKKKFNFMGLAAALATILFAVFLGLMLRESADPNPTEDDASVQTTVSDTAPSTTPSTAPSTAPATDPTEETEPSETIHTHSYTAAEVVEVSCTEDGYTLMACDCGVTYKTEQVKATGHHHEKKQVVKPTCTEKGYTLMACACGDSYKTDEKKATGHKYEVLEKVEPTCTAKGYTIFLCKNCGKSYNGDEVAAKGHSYTQTVIPPTVEAEGYTLYQCRSCDDSYTDNYTEKLPPPTEPPATEPEDPTAPSEPTESEPSLPPVDLPDPTPILKGEYEEAKKSYGIDISKYQGKIDWETVAASGVEFAIVRVGYRTLASGEIYEDYTARYNLQEASKHGIKLGAYFFSTAITPEEAIEEANFTADILDKYPITYPVIFDYEAFHIASYRHYGLTKDQRTRIAMAFLITIGERGYTPMFYGSKSDLQNDNQWYTSYIAQYYKVWLAHYTYPSDPVARPTDYTGSYDMWQYSDKGSIPGIAYSVDMNISHFSYTQARAPIDPDPPKEVEFNGDAMHDFKEVNDRVTSVSVTNLRDLPSTGADSTVLRQLKNGEVVQRIAMSGDADSGWSKLLIDGKVYYAVNYLLTTNVPETEDPPATEPSVTEPISTDPTEGT